MKIIQMNLDDFGIYHNVMWNPPEKGLIVMHGRNESGKTTLMKYVRSMFFGYLRGEWKGYFGHMDIRRENGREYRIYRNEKESYIADGDMLIHEEPARLWWHDLERVTYDNIFAMGLEDLQGFKVLSNEAVRSRFFSIESGMNLGATSRDLQRRMSDLLVASVQGKKPINQLLSQQRDYDLRIDRLAYDEEEFAALQKEEEKTHEEERRIRLEAEEIKLQLERISMPISAWQVYRRGRQAWNHMQELADVSQFPPEGAKEFTQTEEKIASFTEQIESIRRSYGKTDEVPEDAQCWKAAAPQIESLHAEIAQWKQMATKLAENNDAHTDRSFDCNRIERTLREWTDGEVSRRVDWEEGLKAVMIAERLERETEKWQAAKPKAVDGTEERKITGPVRTKIQWQDLGKNLGAARDALAEKRRLAEMLEWIKATPAPSVSALTSSVIVTLAVTVAAVSGAVAEDLSYLYVVALVFFCISAVLWHKRHKAVSYRPQRIGELEAHLEAAQSRLQSFAEEYAPHLDSTASVEEWTGVLDGLRREYTDWQTRSTRESWEREQQDMYLALYDKWQKEGKTRREQLEEALSTWRTWQSHSGFTRLPLNRFNEAHNLWETWHRLYEANLKWESERSELEQRVSRMIDRGEQIFRELSVKKEVTPDAVEAVYKQWKAVQVHLEVAKEQERLRREGDARIAELEAEKRLREARLQELLKQTECRSVGEFRTKALQFERFRQYKEVYEQSESHIRLIAKDAKTYAELQRELSIHDLKVWEDEKAHYESRLAECEKKLAAIAEKRGTVVERLSAMAKNEVYSELLQEKQSTCAELDKLMDEWLTELYAQHMLREAQSYYERVRQPAVIKKAGEYLYFMTGGRYTLQSASDGRRLFAVDGMQRRTSEKEWSSGLGDQIYLAVRVALAMAFAGQIESMPLILDDILVRFDEVRQKEALRFLADLGKTEQVFLFTCSEETRRLAVEVQKELAGETDSVHLFEISKGTIEAKRV